MGSFSELMSLAEAIITSIKKNIFINNNYGVQLQLLEITIKFIEYKKTN